MGKCLEADWKPSVEFVPTWEVRTVINEEQAAELIEQLRGARYIAFDTEYNAETMLPVGMSFCVEDNVGWYVPFGHQTGEEQLLPTDIPGLFGEIFEDEDKTWVMHNGKVEIHTLHSLGIPLKGDVWDTMIATFMLKGVDQYSRPGRSSQRLIGLKERAQDDLNPPLKWCTFRELTEIKTEVRRRQVTRGQYVGQIQIEYESHKLSTEQVPISRMAPYATADAVATYALFHVYHEDMEREQNAKIKNAFYKYEMPFVKVLASLEQRGMKLDLDYLEQYREILSKQRQEIQMKLDRITLEASGEIINWNSTDQKRRILYEVKKFPVLKRTDPKNPDSNPSTDAETLSMLMESYPDDPLLKTLGEFMEVDKIIGTYLDAYLGREAYEDHHGKKHKAKPRLADKNGLIRCDLRQTGAATGRLSSADPNLQNIPTPSDKDKKVAIEIVERAASFNPDHWGYQDCDTLELARLLGMRGAFVARGPGNVLVVADYSQIELRVLAHYSRDPFLMEAFFKGLDMHQFCASIMFEKDFDDVTKDERKATKSINFGIIYGMGPTKLARTLGCSVEHAKHLYAKYYDNFSGVKTFIDETHAKCAQSRFVPTIMGRRRYLPNIVHPDRALRAQAQRQSVNSIIQGSAADICKVAMIKLEHDEVLRELGYQQLNQVHDEIVGECPRGVVEQVLARKVEVMQNCVKLRVPVVAEGDFAWSWGLAK
mgnify:CR=1 FL=1